MGNQTTEELNVVENSTELNNLANSAEGHQANDEAQPHNSHDDDNAEESKNQPEAYHATSRLPVSKEKEIAIEIFVRTLRIDFDLLGKNDSTNNYKYFLRLLTSNDKKNSVRNLLSSSDTKSNVAIHCIPHFFFHEYVFNESENETEGNSTNNILEKLLELKNKRKTRWKSVVKNALQRFSGLVQLDDLYHGIPVYFYIKYFRKEKLFSKKHDQLQFAQIPLSEDTGISLTAYLDFETALRLENVPVKPEVDEVDDCDIFSSTVEYQSDDCEEDQDQPNSSRNTTKSVSHKLTEKSESSSPKMLITLYSLCRISDIEQILESYIDLWLDEEFKNTVKVSERTFEKTRQSIVSIVANYEDSRYQRLKECQAFFGDIGNTNELATALNLIEHRLKQMHFRRKSRLRDILQSKILEIRKEEFFQQHEGKLVIYNSKFPNLHHLAEVKDDLLQEGVVLKHQVDILAKEKKSLMVDNQRQEETIETLRGELQRKEETIETLTDELQSKEETIESLEREKQEMKEMINKLQRKMEERKPYSPRFNSQAYGVGGEVADSHSSSNEEENLAKKEEKTSWLW